MQTHAKSRFWLVWIAGSLTVLAVGALAVGPLHISYSSFDNRNGAAEAMDDALAGLPIKLYYYDHAQIDANIRIPGIYCPASSAASIFSKLRKVRIKEATFNEGIRLDWLESRRAQSARAFGYLYNTSTFDMYQSELRQMCPGIRLQPNLPNMRAFG
jgi:hypothetical protein